MTFFCFGIVSASSPLSRLVHRHEMTIKRSATARLKTLIQNTFDEAYASLPDDEKKARCLKLQRETRKWRVIGVDKEIDRGLLAATEEACARELNRLATRGKKQKISVFPFLLALFIGYTLCNQGDAEESHREGQRVP
jgi:hypothetical protein